MAFIEIENLDLTAEQLEQGDTNEFITKMNSLMSKLQAWSALVSDGGTDIAADLSTATASLTGQYQDTLLDRLNLVPHHGTLLQSPGTIEGDYNGYAAADGVFDSSSITKIFGGINGADLTLATEAGRFLQNSSSVGGARPANDSVASAFAAKAGITHKNTPSFAIAEVQTGTGDASTNYLDCYRFFQCNQLAYLSVNGRVSTSFLFQPASEDAFIRGFVDSSFINIYLDGVQIFNNDGDAGGTYHRMTAGQVYHICATVELPSSAPTSSSYISILARQNTAVRFALPWVAPGAFYMPPVTWPVRSVGTFG